MSNWVSIEDRLPDVDVLVLIHHTFYRVNSITTAFMHTDGDFETEGDVVGCELVTHWQPLPEPPKNQPGGK